MATSDVAGGVGVGVVAVRERLRRVLVAAVRWWTARPNNPWLSNIAVPLGMTAAGLLGQWWVWPILTLDASIACRGTWSWVLGLGLGSFGTDWAFLGCYALTEYRTSTILVGVIWAVVPALIAVGDAHANHDSVVRTIRRALSRSR